MQAMWVLGSYIPRALLPSYIFEHCILHAYFERAIIVFDEDDIQAAPYQGLGRSQAQGKFVGGNGKHGRSQ